MSYQFNRITRSALTNKINFFGPHAEKLSNLKEILKEITDNNWVISEFSVNIPEIEEFKNVLFTYSGETLNIHSFPHHTKLNLTPKFFTERLKNTNDPLANAALNQLNSDDQPFVIGYRVPNN